MITIALNLDPTTVWAATGGRLGRVDMTDVLNHPGRLAYEFGNAVENLIEEHEPARIALARQQVDKAASRTIDCLAFMVAGCVYVRERELVELTADAVRAQVLGNGRAPNDLIISSPHRAGWHVVDEREGMAGLMIEYLAGRKAKPRTLASNVAYAMRQLATRHTPRFS